MRRDEVTLIAGAMLSRLTGFARDAAFAWLLGGGATADALAAALRLPFLARRLFGEGTLSLTLATACGRQAKAARAALARAVTRRLAGGVCLVTLIVMVFAPRIVALFAPGLGERPEVLDQAATLFRITAPYLIFVTLAAGRMAALHSRQRFLLPALAPAAFNVVTLAFAGAACLLVSSSGMSEGDAGLAACWLAGGVLAGGVCQWLMQRAEPERLASDRAGCARVDPAVVRAVLGRIPVGIFGAAMPQLAFVAAAGLASFLPGGHLAALFYAERLLEFPLGVLGAAVGMAAAPRLTELIRREEEGGQASAPDGTGGPAAQGHAALGREVRRAVSLTLALNLPAAAGLMAVCDPLVAFVFGRGAFSAEAVDMTALALCAYAPGLPAYALSRPLLAACHALEDTATPARATATGLGVVLAIGLVLLFPAIFGQMGDRAGECLPQAVQAAIPSTLADVVRANAALVPPLAVSFGVWIYAILLWRGLTRTLRASSGKDAHGFAPAVAALFWEGTGAVCVFGAAWGLARLCADRGWAPASTLCLGVPAGMAVYAVILFFGNRALFVGLLSDIREKRRPRPGVSS